MKAFNKKQERSLKPSYYKNELRLVYRVLWFEDICKMRPDFKPIFTDKRGLNPLGLADSLSHSQPMEVSELYSVQKLICFGFETIPYSGLSSNSSSG
jgi:hypothetical protein